MTQPLDGKEDAGYRNRIVSPYDPLIKLLDKPEFEDVTIPSGSGKGR